MAACYICYIHVIFMLCLIIQQQILNGLGLGINGPPIPPPATFAMVQYPNIRTAPPGADNGHYCFIASSFDDPLVP